MSFETHFFPFWERTKNVSRDTNDFNIDSLMGKKKCLLCFEIHVFHSRELSSTRRWAIDSDGVARLVEMSSVIKVVLLAMCFLVLAFCLVGCYSRWDLSLSDNDSVCYLAPAARYNSQFTFHVFFPKAVFGFTQALRRIFRRTEVVVCHIWSSSDLYKQFRNTNGFVSAVWWILSFGTQITSLREQKMSLETDYSSLWLSTVLS